MADTQPNLKVNTELSGRATLNMDQSTPVAVLAKRESDYRMVEIGRMKPYCLQLDASLIEVMGLTTPTWTHMDIRNSGRYHQDNST